MNPALIEIIQMGLAILEASAQGTESAVGTAFALEQMAIKVVQLYSAEVGKPLDLSSLTPEELIK